MKKTNPKIERVPLLVQPGRRNALRKIILATAACTTPVVASFSRDAIAAGPDISDHQFATLRESAYGTIQNHCTIRLSGQDSLTISRIDDHCIVSGECKTLNIGSMADHCFICTTGTIQHGPTGDHCEIVENATKDALKAWQVKTERPGNPGS
jgi:hypothetical protein